MSSPEGRLAAQAARQLGLFTLHQARTAGLTDKQVRRRVEAGSIERLGSGVFAIAGMPWTWERRAHAGLLAVGSLGWLSHRAAAHHLGFDGFGECPIEITVPRGCRAGTGLAIVHSTTYLNRLDLIRVGRFPVTSGARTIVDLCSANASSNELSAAIGSAMRDGRTSAEFLRKRIESLRGSGRAGIRLLDEVIEGPIAHSHLEREFLKLMKAAGIREPETQVVFDGDRVIRVDTFWRPEKLISELMGHRFHVTREQLQNDAQRRNELQEIGNLVLEFTAVDVAQRPVYVVSRVSRNLLARRPSAA